MAANSERVNVVLPKPLIDKLRALVPARRRSDVIAQALAEKLIRLEQTRALRQSAGAWSDEEHPDLRTYEDYERWIQSLRGSATDRLHRLGLGMGDQNVPSGQ